MIFALNTFSESSSFWGWPTAAAIGGVLVFVGLWMERGIEKHWFSNVKDLRLQQWKEVWGWRILMLGILVEIGIGFSLAAKDEIHERETADQIAQTKTNVDNLDPLKQPVNSVTAVVFLDFEAVRVPITVPDKLGESFECETRLDVSRSVSNSSPGLRFSMVSNSAFIEGQGSHDIVYRLNFSPVSSLPVYTSENEIQFMSAQNFNSVETVGAALDNISLKFRKFPMGTHLVLHGDAKININNVFFKTFSISFGEIKDGVGTLTNSDKPPKVEILKRK